jgi:hypothetical protein
LRRQLHVLPLLLMMMVMALERSRGPGERPCQVGGIARAVAASVRVKVCRARSQHAGVWRLQLREGPCHQSHVPRGSIRTLITPQLLLLLLLRPLPLLL